MAVRYSRSGGHEPMADEWLEVADDGSYWLRRTTSGSAVGRFSGDLGADLATEVASLAATVTEQVSVRPSIGPAVVEVIEVEDGPRAAFPQNAEIPAAWHDLAAKLRRLTEELTSVASAEAAIAAGLEDGSVVLRAIGHQGIEVDLSQGLLVSQVFDRHGTWKSGAAVPLDDGLGPSVRPAGWSVTVQPGLGAGEVDDSDAVVHLVRLTLGEEGYPRPCEIRLGGLGVP